MRKQSRAYSLLETKSIDDASRTIVGVASTPEPDRGGDVMDPKGAKFSLPMPLLYQHKHDQPIGHVTEAKVTPAGISIKAQIAQIDEPGPLKERIDTVWQTIKAGLVKGLSIGWRPIVEQYDKATGNFIYPEWEWYELSAVTVPMNASTVIQSVKSLKSLDVGAPAPGPDDDESTPPAPGPTRVKILTRRESTMKKPLADQIANLEATRAAKAARREDIQTKATEENRTKDEAERTEFATLGDEIKSVDQELADLRELEAEAKRAAKPVQAKADDALMPVGGKYQRVTVEKKLPPGIAFAQYAMCIAKSRGNDHEALQIAKLCYPDDSRLHAALRVKAAVGAGAILTSHWADDLVPYNILQGDFIEYLRPGSIVGKFGGPNPGGGTYPSLNRVPFNVRTTGASAGTTGYWVQEGLPIPVSKMTTFNTTLTWAKVGGLCALTQEEVRFSNPAADQKVRDDIARALNARVDIDFVDPAKAAVANVSPASITDSIVATTPTGTAATNVRKDIAALLALFATANLDPVDLVLIMSATMAAQVSMMTNTLGNDDFPTLTMAGGSLRGIPVIVSEHLTSVGSPSTQTIIMVKASEIFLADDGAVTVDASSEASVEMLDSALVQTGIAGTGASLVSAFQSGLLFIKAQREITWKLRRTTAVQYLSPVAYVAA